MKNNTLILTIILLLTITLLTGCSEKEVETTPVVSTPEIKTTEPIKIGFIMPLTGTEAAFGLEAKKGIELAYDEIKQEKINGREIQIFFEDDKCNATLGTEIIQKMISKDNVKITSGTICAAVAIAIAPIAEQNKVIHLATAASNPKLVAAGEYIFITRPRDNFEAIIMGSYAIDKLSARSFGVLYANDSTNILFEKTFADTIKQRKSNILIEEAYNPNNVDFKTTLSKIAEKKPDAIYIISNNKETPIILKQIKELSITSIIMTHSSNMESTEIINNPANIAEGVYYTMPKQKNSTEFENNYLAKYGKKSGLKADVGYDDMMLLYNAIKLCDNDNSTCIKEKLSATKDYLGASAVISFDFEGTAYTPVIVKKIEQRKIKIMQN